MTMYSLELSFDREVLKTVKESGQQIKIAKPVNGSSANVIWLSVDPFESNVITWEEEYGIYVSDTNVAHGAHIRKISEVDFPAVDNAYYNFTNNHVFEGPFTGRPVGKGTYSATNKVDYTAYPSLTFGLTQTAMVNQRPEERKPLCAIPVLSQQSIDMTPYTFVYIWLQADFVSQTIVSEVSGTATRAKLGGGVEQLSLKYMPQLGSFQPK